MVDEAPSEAEQATEALVAARRAKRVNEAVMPLVMQTNKELQDATLALADLMERRAIELREAVLRAKQDLAEAERRDTEGE